MPNSLPLCICSAPRAHLFTISRFVARTFASRPHLLQNRQQPSTPSGPFTGPSPPRLPKEEQDIFEQLQRQSTGAFSTPRSPPMINQSPDSTPQEAGEAQATVEQRTEKLNSSGSSTPTFKDLYEKAIEARGKGDELHPNVRRGASPEFEGDVNPKTGEVGGPKNEPLRWGPAGEWAYNGRTTDF